jgi:hypothetical protein
MKQLIMAAVLLVVAVTAVNAQEPNDKVVPAPSPEASPSRAPCDVAFAPLACSASNTQAERSSEQFTPPNHASEDDFAPTARPSPSGTRPHFRWGTAFEQSLLFLSVQHSYALTQPKTRRELGGNFFEDYARSVRSLHGWGDGGRFFTNYVAHPMQGSLMGFVQIQNDPAGSRARFGRSGGYWRSRAKALAWSAAWSTQFEVGPLSQASIGNVGLHGKQTYVDIVMTPVGGLGLLVAEDALDRYVIERIERRTNNRYVRILSRMALNPTRSSANLLRFKKPWHRDAGLR